MATEVSAEVKMWLDGLRKEIGAGRVLVPKTPAEHAWNDSAERAQRIITNYMQGTGLWQLKGAAPAQATEGAEQ